MKRNRHIVCACALAVLLLASCDKEKINGRVEIIPPVISSDTSAVTETTETTVTTSQTTVTETSETVTTTETATETSATEYDPDSTDRSAQSTSETTALTETSDGWSALPQTELPLTELPQTETVTIRDSLGSSGTTTTRSDTSTYDALPAAVRGEEITHPYAYLFLTDEQKRIYNEICDGMRHYRSEIRLSKASAVSDIEEVMNSIVYYENELYYFEPGYTVGVVGGGEKAYIVGLEYSKSYDEISTQFSQMSARIYEIESKITAGMNEYDIVKLFHDELVKSVEYDKEKTSAYDALVLKKANCQGYSDAFSMLCNRYGIANIIVTGKFNEPHMWNMVRINEKWYYVDVTADDPGEEKYPGLIEYDYFLIPSERLLRDHSLDKHSFEYPAATDGSLNYYLINGLVAESVDEAKVIAYNQLIKMAQNKETYLQFLCSKDIYDAVYTDFFDNKGINNIVYAASLNGAPNLVSDKIWYMKKGRTDTVKVIVSYQ